VCLIVCDQVTSIQRRTRLNVGGSAMGKIRDRVRSIIFGGAASDCRHSDRGLSVVT
jgi:hypothetical protein